MGANPEQWSNHKNMQAYFVVVVIAQAELFTYDTVHRNAFRAQENLSGVSLLRFYIQLELHQIF